MPIPCPHFKITIVKRSQGQSAVAGAAYQSGERLFSEYDQKTKFYNKKKELVHAEIILPDEASPGAVQFDAPVGDSASAPVGSGTDRREPDAADHAGTAEAEPGSEQRAASDGVGAAHKQPESTGRGTGDERADLQLSFFDAHVPTEAQQIETIDQAESEKTPSAFVLSQAEIENELRSTVQGL